MPADPLGRARITPAFAGNVLRLFGRHKDRLGHPRYIAGNLAAAGYEPVQWEVAGHSLSMLDHCCVGGRE
jgi:hypothetical protein